MQNFGSVQLCMVFTQKLLQSLFLLIWFVFYPKSTAWLDSWSFTLRVLIQQLYCIDHYGWVQEQHPRPHNSPQPSKHTQLNILLIGKTYGLASWHLFLHVASTGSPPCQKLPGLLIMPAWPVTTRPCRCRTLRLPSRSPFQPNFPCQWHLVPAGVGLSAWGCSPADPTNQVFAATANDTFSTMPVSAFAPLSPSQVQNVKASSSSMTPIWQYDSRGGEEVISWEQWGGEVWHTPSGSIFQGM